MKNEVSGEKEKPIESPELIPESPELIPENPELITRETTIIEYLRKNEYITNKIVCELLQLSSETAKKLLQSMVKKGMLATEGQTKGRKYKLLK